MRVVLLAIAGLVVLSTLAFGSMMMVMGMTGHMGMMGGRGSDPDGATPVVGVTDVRIEDFSFQPANIVVEPGTTVTWRNEDSAGHTVTSDNGDELDSDRFGDGESFSHTFDTPGEYRYFCQPHPYMKGLVTVRER